LILCLLRGVKGRKVLQRVRGRFG